MKSSISKWYLFLLLGIKFFVLSTIAMEEQTNHPTEINDFFNNDDVVVEELYSAFSEQINTKFPTQPKNFYEAVVRLKSIATFLEKSTITSTKASEDFKIKNESCEMKGLIKIKKSLKMVEQNISHNVINPFFKRLFNETSKKVLLEHPKSVEAIDLIITRMSENISRTNANKYYQAVLLRLPKIVSLSVQDQFIDIHGWPLDIKPFMTFDENGVKAFNFLNNYAIYSGKNGVVVCSGLVWGDGRQMSFPKDRKDCDNLLSGLTQILYQNSGENKRIKPLQSLDEKENASGCFPPLWEKPTFIEAIQKCIYKLEASAKGEAKKASQCILS